MKILRVEFENLSHFEGGKFKVDFFATDRVLSGNNLYKISKPVHTHNTIGFIGLNATGKTTALRLIKIALNVTINNADLNSLGITNIIQDGTIMRVTFFHNKVFYQLESVIGNHKELGTTVKSGYYYKEEILSSKTKSQVQTRADLNEFNEPMIIRSKLTPSEKNYLDDGKSVIAPVIKGNDCFVGDNLFFNYINVMNTFGTTPAPIIELFDESIEILSLEGNDGDKDWKWNLKFKQDSRKYNSTDPILLNRLVSTGTIRGQGLISMAIEALRTGGYLIIDELEMHLNKEIVRFILSLFKERRTNPNGACLVFTTHYAEVLDFAVFDRKDNLYVTRKTEGLLSATNFSAQCTRNDFKKSELILSNALSGTAPKYNAIQRLRDFVCESL